MLNMDKMYDVVMGMLQDIPDTRNSDRKLICAVYAQKGIDINAPFSQIMLNSELPSFETITRSRRKAQENNSELCAVPDVESERASNEAEVRAWALERGII